MEMTRVPEQDGCNGYIECNNELQQNAVVCGSR